MKLSDIFQLGVILAILGGCLTIVYLFSDNAWRILNSIG